MSWVTVCLERGDQGAQARRENDQVSGIFCCSVGVGGACGHEYCCSGSDGFRPVGVYRKIGFKYGQAIQHGNPIVLFTPAPVGVGWQVQAMHQVTPSCRSLPAAPSS